jgi:adhesin transport system outer membrane protein
MKNSIVWVLTFVLGSTSAQAQNVEADHLGALLNVAVTDSPAVRARKSEVGAAKSEVQTANWQFWPTPSISVQKPDKALVTGTDRSVQTFSLKQPLWTGGRLEAGVALASARQEVAEAAQHETRRDIALEVIQAYGDASTAKARLQVQEASLAVHKKLLEQIRRRAREGLNVQSDSALAESRRDGVLADLESARAALSTSREKLRTLVGREVAEKLLMPGALLPPDTETEDDTQQALKTDPSLQRMQAEARELQAQVDSSASAFWPELSASVVQRHGDVSGRSSQVMIGFESKWGGGFANVTALQAAKQRQQAKNDDMDFRTRRISEQIRADHRNWRAALTRAQAFGGALSASQKVYESWDRQFVAGKKSWQDVMNAAREMAQTEIQLAEAQGSVSVYEWRLAVLSRGVDWVLQAKPAGR